MDPNLMPGGDGSNAPTEAQKTEANEWDEAQKDLFPGLSKVEDESTTTTTTVAPVDESTTTTTTVAPDDSSTTTTTTVAPDESSTTTTTTIDPNETAEQKTEREKKEADDKAAAEAAANPPDAAAREARQTQREAQQQVEAVAKDVREKMFKDAPTVLQDADGDPITSIADVMKLVNPATNEGFTAEEAGMWLLAAQQQFNKNLAEMDKRINQIAETLVDVKDQADAITYKYGDLLKADEPLRDKLWAQYEKTLIKDPESGIITGAPVNMEEFYEIALAPYAKLAENMKNSNAEDDRKAKEAADKAEADRKAKERADRSDIFGRGNVDANTDPEDKEWATAMETVFGPKKT